MKKGDTFHWINQIEIPYNYESRTESLRTESTRYIESIKRTTGFEHENTSSGETKIGVSKKTRKECPGFEKQKVQKDRRDKINVRKVQHCIQKKMGNE